MKAFTALAFGLSLGSASMLAAAEKSDPVVGRWRWVDKQIVECLDDHTFSVRPNNRRGTWKALPTATVERKYALTWDDGLFTDTLMLSRDGKKLVGRNQDGKKIEAVKIE